jgi:hypothetical protein
VRTYKEKQWKRRTILIDDPGTKSQNFVDALKALGFPMDPKMEAEARAILEQTVYADGIRNDLPGIQQRYNTPNAFTDESNASS